MGSAARSYSSGEMISYDIEKPDAAYLEWLSSLPQPCGIFCHHDHVAFSVGLFCRALGLSIPKQIGIIGCGDHLAFCLKQEPHLSSVQLPMAAFGFHAVSTMERLLKGQSPQDNLDLKPHSVTHRHSTNLPAQRDMNSPLAQRAIRLIHKRLHKRETIHELAQNSTSVTIPLIGISYKRQGSLLMRSEMLSASGNVRNSCVNPP